MPTLNILREVSRIMSSSLHLQEVFERAMRLLAAELGIERSRLVIHDKISGQLRIEAAQGLSPEQRQRGVYTIGEGITGSVFASGQPRIVPDVRTEPDFLDKTGTLKTSDTPYSFICLPIIRENRTIGVLSMDKPFVDAETLDQDVRLLTIVTAMIAQVVSIHGLVPLEAEKFVEENKLTELRKTMQDNYWFSNIIGSSPPMMEVFDTVDQVARTQATVLLLGETGTGKEMIAQAIHYDSHRRDRAFVRVNCGALSGQLLESELFGHIKGAFTGAVQDKIGRFQAAHGGTLLLDEISTLEMQLQVKLLRVLQEREFERVGDHNTISTDVRIVAASNVDLAEEVKAKRFREDLYYRLNVVAIRLPPLRERREDIPRLIDHFLDKYNSANGKSLRLISRDVLNLMVRYPWPGNVRELENAIERAVVLSRGDYFTEELLPPTIRALIHQPDQILPGQSLDDLLSQAAQKAMDEKESLVKETVWEQVAGKMERILIQGALKRCNGIKIQAADYLGINRNTLNKKYKEYELQAEESAADQPEPPNQSTAATNQ